MCGRRRDENLRNALYNKDGYTINNWQLASNRLLNHPNTWVGLQNRCTIYVLKHQNMQYTMQCTTIHPPSNHKNNTFTRTFSLCDALICFLHHFHRYISRILWVQYSVVTLPESSMHLVISLCLLRFKFAIHIFLHLSAGYCFIPFLLSVYNSSRQVFPF